MGKRFHLSVLTEVKVAKEKWKRIRRLSTDELLTAFAQGLDKLEELGKIYDGGYSEIAVQMAIEINKILTENNEATKLRGHIKFESPDHEDEYTMLNALHKLTIANIGGAPPVLNFMPAFAAGPKRPPKKLIFREWWNRDVIYRASAAPIGTPAGMIPVNNSPTVPFKKRETVTRRELISLVRNKLGAHQEKDFPVLLDEIDETSNWGTFVTGTPNGDLSTEDGSLITRTKIIPAMIRQISLELLRAYGR